MAGRGRLPGGQSLPPIQDNILGPETGVYDQLRRREIDMPLALAGALPLKMAAANQTDW